MDINVHVTPRTKGRIIRAVLSPSWKAMLIIGLALPTIVLTSAVVICILLQGDQERVRGGGGVRF